MLLEARVIIEDWRCDWTTEGVPSVIPTLRRAVPKAIVPKSVSWLEVVRSSAIGSG